MSPHAEFALALRPRGTPGETRGAALESMLACGLGRRNARLASALLFSLSYFLNNPSARWSVNSLAGQPSRACISG